MTLVAALGGPVVGWLLLVALLGAALCLGWLFERFVLVVVRGLIRKSAPNVDDIVRRAIHPAVLLLVAITGFWTGVSLFAAKVPDRATKVLIDVSIGLFLALGAFILARVVRGAFHLRARSHVQWQPVAALASRISSVIIYVVAFLMGLDHYGLDITPLLTTAGLATLAVALALQDTLANFFSGVWIQTGKALRPGHFVRVEDYKVQGYVVEIGWRTTKIRDLGNFMYVIPNAKIAQSLVIDYYLPVTRMGFGLKVAVPYDADLDKVERICIDEARKASKEVPGLLSDPEPSFKWIPGFNDYAIEGTVGVQIREFVDQYAVQHELRKRILARFRQEGIRIPYPIQETIQIPAASNEGERLLHRRSSETGSET